MKSPHCSLDWAQPPIHDTDMEDNIEDNGPSIIVTKAISLKDFFGNNKHMISLEDIPSDVLTNILDISDNSIMSTGCDDDDEASVANEFPNTDESNAPYSYNDGFIAQPTPGKPVTLRKNSSDRKYAELYNDIHNAICRQNKNNGIRPGKYVMKVSRKTRSLELVGEINQTPDDKAPMDPLKEDVENELSSQQEDPEFPAGCQRINGCRTSDLVDIPLNIQGPDGSNESGDVLKIGEPLGEFMGSWTSSASAQSHIPQSSAVEKKRVPSRRRRSRRRNKNSLRKTKRAEAPKSSTVQRNTRKRKECLVFGEPTSCLNSGDCYNLAFEAFFRATLPTINIPDVESDCNTLTDERATTTTSPENVTRPSPRRRLSLRKTDCLKEKSDRVLRSGKSFKRGSLSTVVCELCDFRCRKEEILAEHMEAEHKAQVESSVSNVYINCPFCERSSLSRSVLESHIRRKHKVIYMCKQCNFSTIWESEYEMHVQETHYWERQCSSCTYHPKDKEDADIHIHTEHRHLPTFKCEFCPYKRFLSTDELEFHMKNNHRGCVNSGLPPLKRSCVICKKSFYSLLNFKNHLFDAHL